MILVTGGAGFIGRQLTAQLLTAGESVRVFDLPHTYERLADLPAEFIAGDITSRADLARAMIGCTDVFHLAADPNLWHREPSRFHQVNDLGSRNVLELAWSAGIDSVVYTSTESILTAVPPNADLRYCALNRAKLIGPYCQSKGSAEEFALMAGRAGKRVIVVNPTLPIGPGDHSLTPPTRMAVRFCQGKLPGYMDVAFNLIDARDVATAMIALLDKGVPGRRYILAGHNTSLKDWLTILGKNVGRSRPRLQIPFALALAYSYISEAVSAWTHEMPDAPVTGVKLARRSMHFDSHTLHDLGITPRSLEESAADAIAFYRTKGWIAAPLAQLDQAC